MYSVSSGDRSSRKKMKRLPKRKVSTSISDSNGIDGESSSENDIYNILEPKFTPVNSFESEIQMRNDESDFDTTTVKNDYRVLVNAQIQAARYLLKCGTPFFHESDKSEMSLHKGSFVETIKLIGEHNETVRNVLLRYSEYILMVDVSVPIDIVTCFAQEVLKSIFEEIGDDVFALIVDNYIDMHEKKQMAVILRYVTCGIVKERFVGLIHISETTIVFLKSAIESLLAKHGLSLEKVRGQGFDGTSNMRDEFNFLKALILKENKSAYYVHCFVHNLHSLVVAVAKEHSGARTFFEMITTLKKVVCAPCNRDYTIREIKKKKLQKSIGNDETESMGNDMCKGSYYTTLLRLVDLFPSISDVLEYIDEEGKDYSSQGEASYAQLYLQSFDFVFYLHLMLHILGITDLLSQALQRKEQDILNIVTLVKSTMRQLQKFRDNGFVLVLKEVSSFCEIHGITMLNLEEDYVTQNLSSYVTQNIPRQKENITYQHNYEFSCFNPIVDWQIEELGDRFSEVSSELLTCMAALNPHDSFCDFDKSKLIKLVKMYPDDFSCEEMMGFEHELDIYIDNVQHDERFSNLNGISDLARMMVETRKHLTFPLVYRLLKLALVLPVATATVERCFYAKEIVKSYLRNQNCDDFVNTCVISVVEKEGLANVTNEDVMNRLRKMEPHGEHL